MKRKMILLLFLALALCGGCCVRPEHHAGDDSAAAGGRAGDQMDRKPDTKNIPENLEQVPDGYYRPAERGGTIEKLTYNTYESMTYEQKSKQLTKTAYVYLPYGYSEDQQYNIFYLMHGGWSNETTMLGTDQESHPLKNIVDHAIQDGKMQPMIIVCPTYNNESPKDSGNYSLALRLTDNYHNELVNDLIPAVEGKYRTFAEGTAPEELMASRDHRGFGGFSMGSVTTWHTFQYCLDYFRYFMPMSGNLTGDGQFMDQIVRDAGYGWEDFFIYAMSGTDDFAYSAFANQIEAMLAVPGGSFIEADNEAEGNVAFRVQEGGTHSGEYANQYFYNGLCWLWNEGGVISGQRNQSASITGGTEEYRGFRLDNVLHSETEGEIHYNVYIPDSYDGSTPYALFFTLPGYEGLYFQGVGVNLRAEEFGFMAQEYHQDMIIAAPQLDDWGETSARQTIALAEYFLSNYNIDTDRVYANGYSGGGETMSLVMGMRPELFTAYLHCSSQWDGSYEPVVKSRTPVYLVIGEGDEYYGPEPSQEAYDRLYELYEREGLGNEEIDRLLVLDIKDRSYFERQGITNQHGGGGALFSKDGQIMGWLFGQHKK